MVSGLVYTFAALLSTISAVASVLFGLYLVSTSLASALSGDLERGSMFLLQAIAMCIAAYTLVMFANRIARRSLDLFEGEDAEDEEYLYFTEEEDEDG